MPMAGFYVHGGFDRIRSPKARVIPGTKSFGVEGGNKLRRRGCSIAHGAVIRSVGPLALVLACNDRNCRSSTSVSWAYSSMAILCANTLSGNPEHRFARNGSPPV